MVGPATAKHQAPTHRLKPQSRHWVWGLIHHRAIKEETIAIYHDWVYNSACGLLHDIQVISNYFLTFDNLFELINKIRFKPHTHTHRTALLYHTAAKIKLPPPTPALTPLVAIADVRSKAVVLLFLIHCFFINGSIKEKKQHTIWGCSRFWHLAQPLVMYPSAWSHWEEASPDSNSDFFLNNGL